MYRVLRDGGDDRHGGWAAPLNTCMTSAHPSPRLWPAYLALAAQIATTGIVGFALLHPDALLSGLDAGFAYQRCKAEIEKRLGAGDLASFDASHFLYDPQGLTGVRLLIEIEHPDGSGSVFYSGCTFR